MRCQIDLVQDRIDQVPGRGELIVPRGQTTWRIDAQDLNDVQMNRFDLFAGPIRSPACEYPHLRLRWMAIHRHRACLRSQWHMLCSLSRSWPRPRTP